jgi:hypothetical protein
MRKILVVPAAVAVALGVAGTASAHQPSFTVSCPDGLTVEGVNYWSGATVDIVYGTVHEHQNVGEAWGIHVPTPDKTVTQSYTVTIDAPDGTQFDKTYSGSVAACTTVTTTSSPAASSTVPPSTAGTSSTVADTGSTPTATPTTTIDSSTSSTPETTVASTSTAATTTSSTVASGIPFTPAGSPTTTNATAARGLLPATGRGKGIPAELFGGTLALVCGATGVFISRRTRAQVKR